MKRYVAIDIDAMKNNNLSFEKWAFLENVYFMSNNDYHACYASKKTLAEYLCISERQVFKIISELEEDGFLTKNEFGHLKVTQKWLKISCIDYEKNADETMQKIHTKEDNLIYKKRVSKDTPKKEPVNSNKSEFTPPSREEISNYVLEHKLCVDIEKFIKYYTASNWRDNKGKQVKNWKLKLITWDTGKEEKPRQQDLSTIPLDQIKDLDERIAEAERRRQINIDKWEAENGIF